MIRTLLLLLFLLTAAAWAEPRTLSFWHAMGGEREVRLKALAADFEKANPDLKVELKRFADPKGRGNDYAELYRNLLQALGEGKPPAMAQMYENWVTQMAEVGELTRLDQPLADVWSDTPAVFLKASTHSDGHRYSVPFNKSVWVLYANRARLDRSDPPQNWHELRQACRSLQARAPGPALGILSPFELFGAYFISQGGRYFDNRGHATFAGPVGLQSAAFVQALVGEDHSCLLGGDASARFAAGDLAYCIDTSSKLSGLEASLGDRLSVLPLPRGAGDALQLTGTQLSVFARTAPATQADAVKLLRFLTSPAQTRSWAMATGYLPTRSSVLDDPIYVNYLKARPGRAVVVASLQRARVQPQVVGWEATRALINDSLERMLYQDGVLESELRRAQSTSQQLIEGLRGKVSSFGE